jgi:hypothetical protein
MKLVKLAQLALLFLALPSYGQFNYAEKLAGITIRPGMSYSVGDPLSKTRISLNERVAYSMGFYLYYPVNKKNDSFIPFHYVKVELNLGFRSGLFTVNDLNQTALVQSRYIEWVLVVPLTWEINDHLAANVGIGGGLVWVRDQAFYSDITPTPTFTLGNSIKASLMFDYHLLFKGKSNAVIGSRILVESSRYAYGELSVYFWFGLGVAKFKDNLRKRFK